MPVREQERRTRQPRHTPHDVPRRQLETAEFGLRRVPAAAAVDVAVDVDRSVPVAFKPLVPYVRRIVPPDDVIPARLQLEQTAAGAVALGDEDVVADHDRVARVDALP